MPHKEQKLDCIKPMTLPQQLSDARKKEKLARKVYMAFKKEEKKLKKSQNKTKLKSTRKKVLNARKKLTETRRKVRRLKKANKEAERKLAEPIYYEIFKASTNPNIPVDILYDTLKFLDRNEVEKCQLVSRWWNRSVLADNSLLPLRSLEEISSSSSVYCLKRVGNKHVRACPYNSKRFNYQFVDDNGEVQEECLSKAMAAHGFKNAIVDQINVDIIDKVDRKFQAFFKNLEERIDVFGAYFIFPTPRSTIEDITKQIQMTKTILDDFIKTRYLELGFSENLIFILQNPKLLDCFKQYEHVELHGTIDNKECLCEQLLSFINTGGENFSICSLDPPDCHLNIGARIVENFLENDNTTSLFIKSISFNYYVDQFDDNGKIPFYHLRKALKTHRATYNKDSVKNRKETIEKYELGRSDGWKLRVTRPNQEGVFRIEFFDTEQIILPD